MDTEAATKKQLKAQRLQEFFEASRAYAQAEAIVDFLIEDLVASALSGEPIATREEAADRLRAARIVADELRRECNQRKRLWTFS